MKKIFDTHGGDSKLNNRTGQTVEVIRPLTEQEADLAETGPMYHIRFPDGFETDAFADELSDIPGTEPKERLFRVLIELDVTATSESNALDLAIADINELYAERSLDARVTDIGGCEE